MKKRVLSVLLIMALFVSCLAFSASAEGEPTLRLSSVSASRGDEVTVDVIMENNPGVTGINFQISYDKTRLQLTGYRDGSLKGWIVGVDAGEKAVWGDIASNTENGVILTLKFKVLDAAPLGEALVELKDADIIDGDLNTVDFKFESGTVTVTCDHEWDAGVITTEPTCTTDGVKTFTCKKCDETKTEPISHEGHKSDGGKVTTEPTCTEPGVKTYKCTVCGEELKTEPVAAEGHKSDKGTITTEPTCTEPGVKTYKCTVCGEVIKNEPVAAEGHKSDKGTITSEPTCTEPGLKTYKCTVCGEVLKTEPVAALGHEWDEGVVTKEPTCTEPGEKIQTCIRCKEAQVETTRTVEVPVIEHNWDEGVVTKEPTNTMKGEKTYTCADCGATKVEELPKVKDNANPSTGDESMPVLYALLVLASAGAAVVVTRKLRKERG